jgi:hypothetical protein
MAVSTAGMWGIGERKTRTQRSGVVCDACAQKCARMRDKHMPLWSWTRSEHGREKKKKKKKVPQTPVNVGVQPRVPGIGALQKPSQNTDT